MIAETTKVEPTVYKLQEMPFLTGAKLMGPSVCEGYPEEYYRIYEVVDDKLTRPVLALDAVAARQLLLQLQKVLSTS